MVAYYNVRHLLNIPNSQLYEVSEHVWVCVRAYTHMHTHVHIFLQDTKLTFSHQFDYSILEEIVLLLLVPLDRKDGEVM